jgi:hypothetical protein
LELTWPVWGITLDAPWLKCKHSMCITCKVYE